MRDTVLSKIHQDWAEGRIDLFWVHHVAVMAGEYRAATTGVRHRVTRVRVGPGPQGLRWSVEPVEAARA